MADHATRFADAGRYEILEELGRGAFGGVRKCLDLVNREFVAIKTVSDEYSDYALNELNLLWKLRESVRCSGQLANDRTSTITFTLFD